MFQTLNEWAYKLLPHLLYPPGFLPTHYYFFKHLNNFLQGKCFHNKQEAENAFQEFIHSPNSLPMAFCSGLWSSGPSFGLRCILQIYVCSGTTIFSEKTGVGGPLADVRWGHICLLHQAKEIFFYPLQTEPVQRTQLVEICRNIQNSGLLRRLVTSMWQNLEPLFWASFHFCFWISSKKAIYQSVTSFYYSFCSVWLSFKKAQC